MPAYLSPGVYVEEIPSGSAPIAGVGTSTAGFIGVVPDEVKVPDENSSPGSNTSINVDKTLDGLTGKTLAETITLTVSDVSIEEGPLSSQSVNLIKQSDLDTLSVEEEMSIDEVNDEGSNDLAKRISAEDLDLEGKSLVAGQPIGSGNKNAILTLLGSREGATLKVLTDLEIEEISDSELIGKVLAEAVTLPSATITYEKGTFISDEVAQHIIEFANENSILVEPEQTSAPKQQPVPVPAKEVKLCTNFSEFKNSFGDFSLDEGQSTLAHAVYGFFRNGGTRCYVVRVTDEADIAEVLVEQFEAIDEIAIVAAPGVSSQAVTGAVVDHCKKMGDRFAILDSPQTVDKLSDLDANQSGLPGYSDYAAVYYPWLKVYDPTLKAEKAVPPSGHMAGIYARVDTQRGVHKAPANEPVLGAVGLTHALSKAKQDGLNPRGVNCIRNLNGNFLVWGARTWGGDGNGEFKYISTRRLFNFLRESIDEGTQWTVFEPNSPELWAAIRRNVSAFLTIVWRSGALFGNTPEQAFYVKCDEETNPLAIREQGRVVTEIGVAVVKPAEFVIFRLSQWAGGQG